MKLNSVFFQPTGEGVNELTDVDIKVNRDSSSDPWTEAKCFEITVGNPYEDKTLYKTFVQAPEDEKVYCDGISEGLTVSCNYVTSSIITFFLAFDNEQLKTANDLDF